MIIINICVNIQNRQIPREGKRMCVCLGLGSGVLGEGRQGVSANGHNVSLGADEFVLKLDCVHSCTTL